MCWKRHSWKRWSRSTRPSASSYRSQSFSALWYTPEPRAGDRLAGHVALREIAVQQFVGNAVAAARQQPQHFIVEAGLVPARAAGAHGPRDRAGARGSCPRSCCRAELQQPVLRRLETRRSGPAGCGTRCSRRASSSPALPTHRTAAPAPCEMRCRALKEGSRSSRTTQRRTNVQLVQEQLDPQLRHMVHDDEHRLVVRIGDRLLRGQQLRAAAGSRHRTANCPGPSARPRRTGRCGCPAGAARRSCEAADPAPARCASPWHSCAVQFAPARLAFGHAAPEARRNDPCAACGPVRGTAGSAPRRSGWNSSARFSEISPARSSCPSGCAGCPRAAGCSGSHGVRPPRPGAAPARPARVASASAAGSGGNLPAHPRRAASAPGPVSHDARPARATGTEQAPAFHPAAAGTGAAAESSCSGAASRRRARCSRTHSARLS